MASKEDCSRLAVVMAQNVARKHGVNIGAKIRHPDFDQVYILRKIEKGMAIAYIPAKNNAIGRDVIKKFPLNEVYDATLAQKLAHASMNGKEPD